MLIVVCGVCGCGKTSVGQLLAKRTGFTFIEGDSHHSASNKEKMSRGDALTDEDRSGWLISIKTAINEAKGSKGSVIACSALKQKYRDFLSQGVEMRMRFVHLHGSREVIEQRLTTRENHFMNPDLLSSQLDALESPSGPFAMHINIDALSVGDICHKITRNYQNKTYFGICGLGVMGTSLARNLGSKGVPLSLYNRHNEESGEVAVAKKLKAKYAYFADSQAFDVIEAFVQSIQKPRVILLMATAGKVVDYLITSLLSHIEAGDVLIDAGNSHFVDTQRRQAALFTKGIHFLGCGVSGGEEGALRGPAIMPGGTVEAYDLAKPFLELMAARDISGQPCCGYMGGGGAGHFVKTVHNGMEYAEMQLLAECYWYLKTVQHLDNEEIANEFSSWQQSNSNVDSYLLDITTQILRKRDAQDTSKYVLDNILDKSGNKGTGNWTTIATSELGLPTTMVASSLFARYLSAFKQTRQAHATALRTRLQEEQAPLAPVDLSAAYLLGKLVNHYQGFRLLRQSSTTTLADKGWGQFGALDLGEICRVWTNGCILKSKLLTLLQPTLAEGQEADLLTKSARCRDMVIQGKPALKKFVINCIERDVAAPCFTEALQFLNGLTSSESPANMIQAQRDYFGAHGYQRTDDESDKLYHTRWLE